MAHYENGINIFKSLVDKLITLIPLLSLDQKEISVLREIISLTSIKHIFIIITYIHSHSYDYDILHSRLSRRESHIKFSFGLHFEYIEETKLILNFS